MYQVKDIVKTATVPSPALGATDEARVLFRSVTQPAGYKTPQIAWVLYRSKGNYVDQPCFEVYRSKRDGLAALERLGNQGYNFRTQSWNDPVPLRPCSCDPNSKYFCTKHQNLRNAN